MSRRPCLMGFARDRRRAFRIYKITSLQSCLAYCPTLDTQFENSIFWTDSAKFDLLLGPERANNDLTKAFVNLPAVSAAPVSGHPMRSVLSPDSTDHLNYPVPTKL